MPVPQGCRTVTAVASFVSISAGGEVRHVGGGIGSCVLIECCATTHAATQWQAVHELSPDASAQAYDKLENSVRAIKRREKEKVRQLQ